MQNNLPESIDENIEYMELISDIGDEATFEDYRQSAQHIYNEYITAYRKGIITYTKKRKFIWFIVILCAFLSLSITFFSIIIDYSLKFSVFSFVLGILLFVCAGVIEVWLPKFIDRKLLTEIELSIKLRDQAINEICMNKPAFERFYKYYEKIQEIAETKISSKGNSEASKNIWCRLGRHRWSEWKDDAGGKCEQTSTCQRVSCNVTQTRITHDWKKTYKTTDSCDTFFKCSRCGEIEKGLIAQFFTVLPSHQWGEWAYSKNDSCEQARVCTRCKSIDRKTNHEWKRYNWSGNDLATKDQLFIYELTLDCMKGLLENDKIQYADFLTFEHRLRANIREQRLYGENETLVSVRNKIIADFMMLDSDQRLFDKLSSTFNKPLVSHKNVFIDHCIRCYEVSITDLSGIDSYFSQSKPKQLPSPKKTI